MVPRRMTAELLAQNIVAHWMQRRRGRGRVARRLRLRLREPGFLLKYWQAVLLVLLLAPWVQPWQPAAATPAHGLPLAEPGRESAGVAGVSVAGSVVALPAERWHVDPWAWVLGLLPQAPSSGWHGSAWASCGSAASPARRTGSRRRRRRGVRGAVPDIGHLHSAAGRPDALQDRLAELTERQAGQRLWSWTLPAAPPDVSRERMRATPSHAPEEDAVEGRP